MVYPAWVKDPMIHKMFMRALYYKEVTRSEPVWYRKKADFVYAVYTSKIRDVKIGDSREFGYYVFPYGDDYVVEV